MKIESRCKTGRIGTARGDFPAAGYLDPVCPFPLSAVAIGSITLQGADGYAFIDFSTATGRLAGMKTSPSQYPGKRHFFSDDCVGFITFAQHIHSQITGQVNMRRTGDFTWEQVRYHP